jgi:hypothetical protein
LVVTNTSAALPVLTAPNQMAIAMAAAASWRHTRLALPGLARLLGFTSRIQASRFEASPPIVLFSDGLKSAILSTSVGRRRWS